MKKEKDLINTARLMIKDYLYYGYGIKTFLEQDYEITKILGIPKIKELFQEQFEVLGNMD